MSCLTQEISKAAMDTAASPPSSGDRNPSVAADSTSRPGSWRGGGSQDDHLGFGSFSRQPTESLSEEQLLFPAPSHQVLKPPLPSCSLPFLPPLGPHKGEAGPPIDALCKTSIAVGQAKHSCKLMTRQLLSRQSCCFAQHPTVSTSRASKDQTAPAGR